MHQRAIHLSGVTAGPWLLLGRRIVLVRLGVRLFLAAVAALDSRPRECEERVLGFFDSALLGRE